MAAVDGFSGFLGDGYLDLWSCDDLVERNEGYRVAEFAPGLVGFGSDGGGEMYAFRTDRSNVIVRVPFIPLDVVEAIEISGTFVGFLESVARGEAI